MAEIFPSLNGATYQLPLTARQVLAANMQDASTVEGAALNNTIVAKIDGVFVNVRDHGASGDGTTNDRAAIQSCLDVIAASTGGTVYFPAGTYFIDNQLTVGSNTEIRGAGAKSVIAPSFASGKAGVILNDLTNGNSNITFRNIRLDRSGANVQHGILLNGVTNLVLDGLEVIGVPSTTSGAVAVSGILPGGSSATLRLSSNVRVQRCYFAQAGNFGIQLSYVTNVTVSGNVFEDCYREAVGVEPEVGCTATNVTISGNSFTTTSATGGSATGVVVATTSSGGEYAAVTISGNTITNTLATAANSNPGIDILGVTNTSVVTVSGNVISGMNGNGINIGNASVSTGGVVVTGNVIYNCNCGANTTWNGAGISLRQAQQCVISGNYVYGSHHTASVYESQSGAGFNLISGNQLRDATPVVLFSAASPSMVSGNLPGTRKTVSAAYAMKIIDTLVGITAITSSYAITLPPLSAAPVGAVYVVVDESNTAATNAVTVACAGSDAFTDASTSASISINGGKVSVYSNGTKWVRV